MKRTLKRITASILVTTCVIGGNAVPVLAYDAGQAGVVEPCYVGVNSKSCSLTLSSGTATCTGTVNLKNGYSAKLTLKLQQRKSGGSWSTIQTWTASGTRISKSRSVSSGYEYRATLSAKIYDSSGTQVDSLSAVSAVKP